MFQSLKESTEIRNYPNIDIRDIDKNTSFFHYTSSSNLKEIFEKGLEPRIGKNATVIEKSKKVFFTVGEKNTLIIMDVWLMWLLSRPKNQMNYKLGAYFMTKPYFPKFIYDIIFGIWHKSERKLEKAFKELDEILLSSVFLVLDLEEKIDFDYEDYDEVKVQNFPRRMMKNIYKYGSDLDNPKMELWNMHTYSNKVIEKEKITLLKYKDSYDAKRIIQYLALQHKEFVEENCDLLKIYLRKY